MVITFLICKICRKVSKYITYHIFSKKRPPPKLPPPLLFFSILHFSEEIWTEILSKMMKKYNTMRHFQRLWNRYLQWISRFWVKFSILVAFHEKIDWMTVHLQYKGGSDWRVNSRKSVRWSAVPVAPMWVCGCEVVRGAAAPKGPMTYAVFIWASRLELGPWGWDLSLKAGIWVSWLAFELWG